MEGKMIVNQESCIGCKQCQKDCIVNDISIIEGKAFIHNQACIKCGHCIAICPTNSVSCEDESEYRMSEVIEARDFGIDSKNLLDFMKFRRSVRSFKSAKIEEKKLEAIIEAGRYSPTGRNAQDVSYILIEKRLDEFRDKVLSTLHSLAQRYLASDELPKELRIYPQMWLKIHQDFYENAQDRLFYHAPNLIIIKAKDVINGALALSRMELMINALGLGCFISGFCKRAVEGSKELQKYLGLDEGEHLIACLVIGYPKVRYKRSTPRKEVKVLKM